MNQSWRRPSVAGDYQGLKAGAVLATDANIDAIERCAESQGTSPTPAPPRRRGEKDCAHSLKPRVGRPSFRCRRVNAGFTEAKLADSPAWLCSTRARRTFINAIQRCARPQGTRKKAAHTAKGSQDGNIQSTSASHLLAAQCRLQRRVLSDSPHADGTSFQKTDARATST